MLSRARDRARRSIARILRRDARTARRAGRRGAFFLALRDLGDLPLRTAASGGHDRGCRSRLGRNALDAASGRTTWLARCTIRPGMASPALKYTSDRPPLVLVVDDT